MHGRDVKSNKPQFELSRNDRAGAMYCQSNVNSQFLVTDFADC